MAKGRGAACCNKEEKIDISFLDKASAIPFSSPRMCTTLCSKSKWALIKNRDLNKCTRGRSRAEYEAKATTTASLSVLKRTCLPRHFGLQRAAAKTIGNSSLVPMFTPSQPNCHWNWNQAVPPSKKAPQPQDPEAPAGRPGKRATPFRPSRKVSHQ